jgi:dipeptidase D
VGNNKTCIMDRILRGLQPEIVWSIFEEITRVPRCSKNEGKLQDYVEKWAAENGVEFRKDETGNILLVREAKPGCEDYPTLLLQGHQDMVCEKDPDSPHDFDKDSIPIKVEGGRVAAEGTTLGADNGIGMALAMALVSDPNLERHGRIEAVFTIDEESGFTGVRNLKADFFTGKRMINMDSEEVGVIIVSSAGGGGTEYQFPVKREDPGDWEALRVDVGGLLGGHSGVDIHLPRFSANILLAQGLGALNKQVPIRLIHIEGGTRGNAITRSSYAEILAPKGRKNEVTKIVENWASGVDRSMEKGLTVKVSPSTPNDAADHETSTMVISLISEIPQGVFSWSTEYEDLVQTSNNLGILRTELDAIKVPVSSRTSDAEDFKKNQAELRELGEKYGAQISQRGRSTGWRADPDSKFLDLVVKCYEKVYGKKPKVTGIHGGLECGVFTMLDPEMDIVSIGPTIKYPHSPNEYLEIESVATLWEVVKTVAERINEV